MVKDTYEKNKERKDIEEIIKSKLNKEYIFHSKAKRYAEFKIENGKISVRRCVKECKVKELSFGKNILFTSKFFLSPSEIISYLINIKIHTNLSFY